ncbi:unnamed protein product [Adineta steineri]|uniref:Apple domain-containing protein n=1 Tax=Adineta steineri TaxID=433720 RepID=A0A819CSQ1_9BILA|nr:unnamed protein product [Adineta steineri]CAF3817508.1 unnamed protein product [Adineta steineri]
MIYRPVSLCTFIRNASLPINTSLQSCIWECVYEDRCQTAVYFNDENVCSMFTESCNPNSIQPSGNTRATVICYGKNQATTTSELTTAAATTIMTTAIATTTTTTELTTVPTATTTTTTELTTVPATTTELTTVPATTTELTTVPATTTELTTVPATTTTIPAATIIMATATPINTMCPIVSCFIIPSVQNPAANYQLESLDFSCSSSLSDFFLIQMVQRNYNETYAQQYQTFWSGVTTMSVVQNTSNIIFTWYSLLGQIVDIHGFPYHTEGQFYHEADGSARNTTNDTWFMTVQSTCGSIATYSGTF